MATTQTIQQKLLVKKVIKKANSKFGKASIIVPMNGKDEFLGLNDGVDENAFVDGKTYDLEIAISKTGKRYVNGIIAEDAKSPAPAVAKQPETKPESQPEPKFALDRDTRITYMNVANVAAQLAAGDLDAFDKSFDHVEKKYKEKGVL